MKLWSTAAALLLLTGAVLAAPAPRRPRGGRPPAAGPMQGRMGYPLAGMGGPMGRHLGAGIPPYAGVLLMHRQMLNLTDDQVRRLQAMQADQLKQQIRGVAEARIAGIDLMQLLQQPNPDRGKVEAAVRDLGRRATDIGLAYVRGMLDARGVLTDEQRRMVASMGPSLMQPCPMRGQMMGGGMMGGMGGMGGGAMGGGAMGGGAGGGAGMPPAPPAAQP